MNQRLTKPEWQGFTVFSFTDGGAEFQDMHSPYRYKLILFLSENTVILLNGKEIVARMNDILLLSPSDTFMIQQKGKKICGVRITLDLLHTLSTPNTDFIKLFDETSALENYGAAFIEKALSVFKKMNEVKLSDEFGDDVVCRYEFAGLLVDLYGMRKKADRKEVQISERHSKSTYITACSVMNYIDHNYMNPQLTLKNIASTMFISVSRLSHVFKEQTGESVYEYLTGKRLRCAYDLILRGNSVMEACSNSGFRSYCSFYRIYVKHYGVAPTFSHGRRQINNTL